MRRTVPIAVIALMAIPLPASPQAMSSEIYDPNYLGTFSIIGRDPATGELGMGVQSKAFGAGNRAMHDRESLHRTPPERWCVDVELGRLDEGTDVT